MQTITINNKYSYAGAEIEFKKNTKNFLNFIYSFQYIGYSYTSENLKKEYTHSTDDELTVNCMNVSEKSLKEGWDKEDDERWNSFLNEI